MKKLDIIGIILPIPGIISAIVWLDNCYNCDIFKGMLSTVGFSLGVYLPLGIAIGIWVLPRVAERKKKSDFEKRKNNQNSELIKDQTNTKEKKTKSEIEINRQCNVCKTNIPNGVKKCPGCGDIYS
ncbi:MAG TPA: hypothetical protein VMW74_03060 [Nitrosopumilaceae archaeon]|nr:hypothetical protein [Nitrosopumilaceae archaeon]